MARQLRTYLFSRKPGTETNVSFLVVASNSRKRARRLIKKEYSLNPKDYKVERAKKEEILHHTYVRKTVSAEHSESPMID